MADDIGDVYVDVGADTSTLESKLKAKLDALSKKLQAKVQAVVDTKAAQASLTALRAAAQRTITVPVRVADDSLARVVTFGEAAKKELNAAIGTIKILTSVDGIAFVKAQIRALPGVAKSVVADVRAAVSTAFAGSKLEAWVKEQSLKTVHIGVDISKAALAKASATLGTFTGLNAVRGEFEKFSQGLTSFFNDLPGIAQTVLKLTSKLDLLGTGLGSVFSTIMALLPAISGLGAAALALPGILAAGAAEAVVLVVAIKNAPPAVKAAIKSYKELGKEIGNNFWAGAKTQVVDFFNGVRDSAKTGLDAVAKTMGNFTGSFAQSLNGLLTGGNLDKIFSNINAGLTALAPAAEPFATILTNLGLYGTSLLPGISGWLVKISTQFSGWLQNAMQTGQLNKDLQGLGDVITLVWNGAKGLIGIITGLGTAAQNAGIGNLLSPLQMIAGIVNSPTFQTALTTIFEGMAGGAKGLLAALTPIGNMLATLAPTISNFLTGAGATIGSLFTSLANSLNSPVFQQGLSSFFSGILDFVKPLIPIMPVFAEKLAMIGTFAGNLLTTLGPVFATLISALVPILGSVLSAVSPLVDALGPVLSGVFKALAPVILAVVKGLTPFISMIIGLLPPILKVVDVLAAAFAPYLTMIMGLFQQLVGPIMQIVGVLLTVLTPILGPLIGLIGQLVSIALKPLIDVFNILAPVLVALEPILTLLGEIIGAVIQTIVDLMTGNFSDIGKIWANVWGGISDYWNSTVAPFFQGIGDFFAGIWNGITKWFTDGWNNIMKGLGLFGSLLGKAWDSMWNGVGKTFNDIWAGIQSFAKGTFNNIEGAMQGFINGAIDMVNGLAGAINNVSGVVGIPKIPKIGHVSLPRLATGATVLPRAGGTAAILGEGGRAESVVDTGMMNKLLATILQTFPAMVSALRNSVTSNANGATTSNNSTTNNHWENRLEMPDTDDPKAAAQEFVNRLADQVA